MANELSFQDLLERLNIVNVVNDYVPLKKQGANYVGLCPFHNDRNPSMTVSESKQIFKCFVCNIGGNAIKFVSLADKIPYVEAGFKLAESIGIEIKRGDSHYEEKSKLKNDIRSLNKEVGKFYFENLKNSPEALDYLKNRGLSNSTVLKFGLGFAPDNWSSLYDHFSKMGISTDLMLKAGLITETRHNGNVSYIDKFRGRIMFPIFDDQGNVIAFGGRIIVKDEKSAKYINSQETPAYIKGEHLYGLNIAKNTTEKKLIVVEGYMDCIALHQKGIDFAVASLGTALTQKQAKLIRKKGFNQVILAYDNDGAGKLATIRGMDILKAEGLDVRIFRLTGAKDADEYLKNHPKEEFIKQLDKTYSLFEYKVMLASEEYPPVSNEYIIRFLNCCKSLLSKLPETDRQIYTLWIESNYGKKYNISREMLNVTGQVSEASTKNETNVRSSLNRHIEEQHNLDEESKKIDFIEKTILILLCNNSNLLTSKNDFVNEELFTLDANAKLFRKVVDFHKAGDLKGESCLYDGSENDSDIAGVVMQYQISNKDAESALKELSDKLKNMKIDKAIQETMSKINNLDVSQKAERNALFNRLQELQKEKKKLSLKN